MSPLPPPAAQPAAQSRCSWQPAVTFCAQMIVSSHWPESGGVEGRPGAASCIRNQRMGGLPFLRTVAAGAASNRFGFQSTTARRSAAAPPNTALHSLCLQLHFRLSVLSAPDPALFIAFVLRPVSVVARHSVLRVTMFLFSILQPHHLSKACACHKKQANRGVQKCDACLVNGR